MPSFSLHPVTELSAGLSRRRFLQAGATAVLAGGSGLWSAEGKSPFPAGADLVPPGYPSRECDVFVYGSSAGGVAAACEAARRGCSVILACPKTRPGGMPASGLSTTDVRQKELYGGFVQEFIGAIRAEYRRTLGENSPEWELIKDGWYYEPSVAERVFEAFLAQVPGIEFLRAHHLIAAEVSGRRVTRVTLDQPRGGRLVIRAKTFIDCTYEGDLAAAAKVPYRVGRESREEYGESLAGICYMDYRTKKWLDLPETGESSPAIQAYCARSIYTSDPAKMVRIEKPATYELHKQDLLPLLDDFAGGLKLRSYGTPLPGRKFQANGSITARTSLNCPGVSWTWPEAQRAHRAELERFHIDHAASLTWFLQNEPAVPAEIRAFWSQVGLHRDEFADTGHWPWQIYVRQGRRIEGRAIVTQHNFTIQSQTGRTPVVAQPIAIGDYMFDVHPCHDRRYQKNGLMEGVLWFPPRLPCPAFTGQVPYGAMLPRQLDNLLVPVALSSSHIGMSVLRMEPVWMTTGQIAGLAAAEAKKARCAAADIDPAPLPGLVGVDVDPWKTGRARVS